MKKDRKLQEADGGKEEEGGMPETQYGKIKDSFPKHVRF